MKASSQGIGSDLPALKARYPEHFAASWTKRAAVVGVVTVLSGLFLFGFWRLDFSLDRILSGIGKLGTLVLLMLPPNPGSWAKFFTFIHALAETVAIAFLGTLLAALVAFPIGLVAARNTTVNRLVQFASRRLLDGIRGIDTLIWALLWINVVGLGPFAGVLAIMTSDIGTFGKLFSEAIEAADRKPVEGIISTGGTRLHQIRFGILPQVFPVIAGQVLYFFESNTRSGTIIGIVGAGGIGLHLAEQIRTLEWQAVSFLVLLILVMVAVIDALSARLRRAIIGRSQQPPM
ncbi:phosphonate transport system permease protein [Microvirga flocculans]|uniref:Phosphonate transport system permease protein n=1 Tax=Microvirga flocculans TaxID=217168 RepID=A0A7W6ICP9_9HYPH|nr:phosphonate ABC transporter, permease protein PhnE [Microvirga flocculans]MBB4038474.1 phosphonate transport system permease protein [Microvirga flocculans]